ncbi:ATP-dependent nuclease [Acetobacter fabarum]|uniref:ATP-dependent nuclease n=3 Tax=Acetobacter fabarum TaxID=483199 RepID=UPI0015CF29A4|nr:ATP-binding protein [Acetobacter fabarum]
MSEKYIKITIKNLRSINDFSINLPLMKGIVAICGGNGIGKSTLFSALSQIVYKSALNKYFRHDGGIDTEIKYEIDGTKNIWKKSSFWSRSDDSEGELYLKGMYEASIIFGNRFSDAISYNMKKFRAILPSDVCDADSFIIDHLGEILKGDKTFYQGLKRVRYKTRAKILGFNRIPYLYEKNGQTIHQILMSSGEFLLIGLLHFLHENLISKRSINNSDIILILLDELELALHPSAQDRLISFLKGLCDSYNVCVYFSTHSTQILGAIKSENIFYLEKQKSGKLLTVNPCYPAYASRAIYRPDGFDFVLLVEDDLAKHIIDKILSEKKLKTGRLIKILSCGGWEKTLELQKEIQLSKLCGDRCKIISILDKDIKEECEKKEEEYKGLAKLFLPIDSIEKYLKFNLITSPDEQLIREIGDEFFIVRPLQDILDDYISDARTNSKSNGKDLFRVLLSCAEEQGTDRVTFKRKICDFISNYINDRSFSEQIERIVS